MAMIFPWSPAIAASRMMRRAESMVISQSMLEMSRSTDCTLDSGYAPPRHVIAELDPAIHPPSQEDGCAGQAHECPARFVLSCRFLHRGTSTTCPTTSRRSGGECLEVE